MLERPDASTTPVRRFRARHFALLGVVVALVIAIPAVLLAPWPSCGCTSPTDLAIINYAREDVGVSWQGQGVFGTGILGISGSATVAACTTYSYVLHPGPVDVTIRDASDELSVQLEVPAGAGRGAHAAIIVIGADGHIAEPVHQPPAGGYPEGPLCN
jgi:hypothetical protein